MRAGQRMTRPAVRLHGGRLDGCAGQQLLGSSLQAAVGSNQVGWTEPWHGAPVRRMGTRWYRSTRYAVGASLLQCFAQM